MKIYSLAFLLLFQFPFAGHKALEFPASSPITDSQQKLDRNKSGVVNIVFKSNDGGQTWLDISEGLPENLQEDGFQRDGLFANDNGLYLRAENGIYYSKSNSTAPFWKKEIFPDKQGSIAPGKTGIFAYNYNDGQFLQKINGTSVWSPMYTNFQEKEVRTVFETAGGTVFIGCDKGLFKSTNSGTTWKQVLTRGWVMKLIESNGVLLATSQGGIIRSTDDGENWDRVISEGGVGIAVERIKGGFAAITYNTQSETRRVRTSYDGGKTWQPDDAGRQDKVVIDSIFRTWNDRPRVQTFMTAIIQVGETFLCTHPDGIFRSSDKGKTWKLLLPAVEGKVFAVFFSGNVIYAIPSKGGC